MVTHIQIQSTVLEEGKLGTRLLIKNVSPKPLLYPEPSFTLTSDWDASDPRKF